jgi:putative polyketide hydroxylase
MTPQSVPVLIVGGGLTGLSAAAFLAWHRVPVLLVERRSATLRHPRARAINPRTVELYRGIGLQQQILAKRSHVDGSAALLLRAANLAGQEIWRRPAEQPTGDGGASPCPWATIDQDVLEDLVHRHARRLGADVRYDTELVDLAVSADGVRARLRDAATSWTVHARYLVAADGGRGHLRSEFGIGTHGPGRLHDTFTFVFEADLGPALRGRQVSVAHLDQPVPGTVLLPHDGERRWVFSAPYDPATSTPASLSEPECADLVRSAAGLPGLPVRLLEQFAGTRVLTYRIGAQVADAFRHGPAFLAGDAAHLVPPAGAFGASTAVQDAHNLAWKLAAVLGGQAGEALLDTYDAERRPVAEFTLEQAMAQARLRSGEPGPRSEPPVEYEAVVWGYRYASAAVVGATTPAPALPPQQLRAQPGTRAPHVVVVRGNRTVSTLDLYRRRMTLLTGASGGSWRADGARLANEYPVRAYQIGTDLTDRRGDLAARYGLRGDAAVLVRPDGFVAWRSDGGRTAPLARVLDRVLHR